MIDDDKEPNFRRPDYLARARRHAADILTRMAMFALDIPDEVTGLDIVMDRDQINAANIYLRKFIPDLATQTLVVEDRQQLTAEQINEKIITMLGARPDLIGMILEKRPDLLPLITARLVPPVVKPPDESAEDDPEKT